MTAPFRVFDPALGDRLFPFFDNSGAPSNGTTGTFAGVAKKGALLIDSTNGNLYQNTNTLDDQYANTLDNQNTNTLGNQNTNVIKCKYNGLANSINNNNKNKINLNDLETESSDLETESSDLETESSNKPNNNYKSKKYIETFLDTCISDDKNNAHNENNTHNKCKITATNTGIIESPKNSETQNIEVQNIVQSLINKEDNNNGWDHEANITITNWYNLFKQQSFIYQWVLDRNRKLSNRLATISIVSSSLLGVFTSFKLWIPNDNLFQTISNIILMLSNFGVALITSLYKRYIDYEKNENIRSYIDNVDSFIGELAAQVLKASHYRMNADKFFFLNNDKYTKLVSRAPNLSISDIIEGKKEYNRYMEESINV
jgi:hypothetical protein